MRKHLGKWYPFALLGFLILVLTLAGLACVCTGVRQNTPTPTRVSVAAPATATHTAIPRASATLAPPSPTQTEMPPSTPTTQVVVPTNTLAVPANLSVTPVVLPTTTQLTDPSPNEIDAAFRALSPGAGFVLRLNEDYVNKLALEYLDTASDLPIDVSDILVDFISDQVEVSAIIPFGFFRVEVTATGHWRAVNCKFEAEILDVLIAGQDAPASLREQIDPMLKEALEVSASAPVCFSQVEITGDMLVISGHKE